MVESEAAEEQAGLPHRPLSVVHDIRRLRPRRSNDIKRTDGRVVFLLNWSAAPKTLSFTLDRPRRVREVWSGEDLGTRPAGPVSLTLPAHAGRVLVCAIAS